MIYALIQNGVIVNRIIAEEEFQVFLPTDVVMVPYLDEEIPLSKSTELPKELGRQIEIGENVISSV